MTKPRLAEQLIFWKSSFSFLIYGKVIVVSNVLRWCFDRLESKVIIEEGGIKKFEYLFEMIKNEVFLKIV